MTAHTAFRTSLVVVLVSACGPKQNDDFVPSGGGGPVTYQTPSKGQMPLIGGTLSIVSNGRFAAAADPDRNVVTLVSLAEGRLLGEVRLPNGSRPWRSVEDDDGQLHVALRGNGQVATIDLKTMTVTSLESVCAEPRGLAWDRPNQRLLVACAGGELISRPKTGSSSVSRPGGELRDVLLFGGQVSVSTFREARLAQLDSSGAVAASMRPPNVGIGDYQGRPVAFEPNTAWRTLVTPNGQFVMLHQRAVDADVRATTDLAGPAYVQETKTTLVPQPASTITYYGTTFTVPGRIDEVSTTVERQVCTTGVVRSAISVFAPSGELIGSKEILGILPVDAALNANGTEVAVAAAGNHLVVRFALSDVTVVSGSACGIVQPLAPAAGDDDPVGQPVAVAFTPAGTLVVQSRSPATLTLYAPDQTVLRRINLSNSSVNTPGHRLFHTATTAVACASCHPEGHEDGHVWNFFGELHRTQDLHGVAQTAPYHWKGDRATMNDLLADTFVVRMGGVLPASDVSHDLSAFLDALPARKAPLSDTLAPEQVARGAAVFASAGCNSCHSGAAMTDNRTVDVGTGGSYQVPSLVGLAARAPYMHSGCAKTLDERFTDASCGGGEAHGAASRLSPTDLASLITYLKTL